MNKKSSKSAEIKKETMNETKEKRSRNWATIIYPDSAPENFRDIISELMIEALLSPLHTDQDEEKQLEKKPHYHLEIKFSTMKSKDQTLEIVSKFGGVGAEAVNDFRAYARYLCHLDQPNKKQYDPKEVRSFGSLDYLEIIEASADKYKIVGEIMDYIDQHPQEIKNSFSRLLRVARIENESWFRHLCDDCAYIIKEYLTSKDWDERRAIEEQKQMEYERLCEDLEAERKRQADERRAEKQNKWRSDHVVLNTETGEISEFLEGDDK